MKLAAFDKKVKPNVECLSGIPKNALKIGIIMVIADLYRKNMPDLPRQFSEPWKKIFQNILPDHCKAVFTEVAYSEQTFSAQVDMCTKARCDLIVVLPLAYASSEYALKSLCTTKLPLLLISSCRDETMPYDMTGEHLLANQSVHGVQELTNMLYKKGKSFFFLAGHPNQKKFKTKLHKFLTICNGVKILKTGRAGMISKPLDGMLDFRFDSEVSERKLGFEVVRIEAEDIINRAAKIADNEVSTYLHLLKKQFTIDNDIADDDLNANARISMALENVVDEFELDAVGMNFMSLITANSPALPFLGACRLMAKGIGYAGEGDVLTAILNTAISKIVNLSTFTEMFCPDYARNEMILSHMGECNYKMANPAKKMHLKSKTFAWGDCKKLIVPVFQLKPGPATLVSITETPDEWVSGHEKSFRLIVAKGEIIDSPEHPNLRNPYTRISFGDDMSDFLENYSRAGGTHHLVLAHGDIVNEIETLAGTCEILCKTI